MFTKVFDYENQKWNMSDTFRSRTIAYTPELYVMEWQFYKEGYVIPMHDHYHTQICYLRKGHAKVILADGTECIAHAGDAIAFGPNEAHSVITLEDNVVLMDIFNPMRVDHLENHKKLAPEDIPPYEI